MSITNVTWGNNKEEKKDFDININISAKDIDLSRKEYGKELKKLGKLSENSSVETLLRELGEIIEEM